MAFTFGLKRSCLKQDTEKGRFYFLRPNTDLCLRGFVTPETGSTDIVAHGNQKKGLLLARSAKIERRSPPKWANVNLPQIWVFLEFPGRTSPVLLSFRRGLWSGRCKLTQSAQSHLHLFSDPFACSCRGKPFAMNSVNSDATCG